MRPQYKIPESVLVVIYTPEMNVLLIERTDQHGFWQSVTGSRDTRDEPLARTAKRELFEETGIDAENTDVIGGLMDWCLENVYEIYPAWRHRYAAGVMHNTEHVFGLCVREGCPVTLNPREHTASRWLPYLAAADACFSPSNAEAILLLPTLCAALTADKARSKRCSLLLNK